MFIPAQSDWVRPNPFYRTRQTLMLAFKLNNRIELKNQRNGWFEKDGERHAQVMTRADGVQRGLVSISSERGLFDAGLRLKGARCILDAQPDLQEQNDWLKEIVDSYDDCIIDFYHKFHCEFISSSSTGELKHCRFRWQPL